MLQINIPEQEFFDERTETFVNTKECTLQLEHSLISISKWEAKWCKPFLGKEEKTEEETLDYIRCMTISKDVDPIVYHAIPLSELEKVRKYIHAPMTATWFSERDKKPPSRKVITSELVYYWMAQNGIWKECEKWHFNRLMTLIRICGEMNQPPKKMSRKAAASQRSQLNAARRAKYNSKG